jgi:glutamine synthetase
MSKKSTVVEYVWIDGKGELRSKTRVINYMNDVPEWNFDASSTGQVNNDTGDENTEGVLKPVKICQNPLRKLDNSESLLALCDVYDIHDNPMLWNNRCLAKNAFSTCHFYDDEPWFGLEQEYFFQSSAKQMTFIEGEHYCGTYLSSVQRKIVDEHLDACLSAGLTISGTNAEVSPNQWEFQIGPCVGIDAGDQLWIARFLLQRIAEKYEVKICYHPKPYPNINGSGCHTNFSTRDMRSDDGIFKIHHAIQKLQDKHNEHMAVYGEDNKLRLSGTHETSPYNTFSHGIGTRHTSIRVGFQTFHEKKGYFEDRRPAANADPYLVTSKIYKTCCDLPYYSSLPSSSSSLSSLSSRSEALSRPPSPASPCPHSI